MQLKDHEQTSAAWASRRGQRCLGFALLFILILTLPLFELPSLSLFAPRKTALQLDTLRYNGFSHYASTPDAGAPPVPFRETSTRKSSEQRYFNEQWTENARAEAHSVFEKREEEEPVLTRDELEKREGILIGLR